MLDKIQQIREEAEQALARSSSTRELEELQRRFIGRKGKVALLIQLMPTLPPEERSSGGQAINRLKEELSKLFEEQLSRLKREEEERSLREHAVDVTLPGKFERGSLHPIMHVMEEVLQIFTRLGYTPEEGPEIETEYFNFDALNIPRDHPARDMHDTFYLTNDLLLRTHTSPVQIHVMQRMKPPLAIVVPGRVYRCDADASHAPMFHQVEGLFVDAHVSFADLKGTLTYFLREFFGPESQVRFRPSFFPFTEPSAEVDVQCFMCQGGGCRLCKGSGWLEIMGAGMVHPNVFRAVKLDPRKVRGFAFGMGVERLAMLRYHIDDIRLFFDNDVRFLRQFEGLTA